MKKIITLLCVGFLFCTSMFAGEFRFSFPKPAEGKTLMIYVNGHQIYICNNQYWSKNDIAKSSWIKFYLNEQAGSKVTFEKEVDKFYWSDSSPAKNDKIGHYDKRQTAHFLNLTSFFSCLEPFVFYEDGNKYIIELTKY